MASGAKALPFDTRMAIYFSAHKFLFLQTANFDK